METYWLLGAKNVIHADESFTGGRYDLIEGWFPAGVITPLHRHTRFSEHLARSFIFCSIART